MKKSIILSSLLLSSSLTFAFDIGSITKTVIDNINNTSTTNKNISQKITNLDNSTVSNGLKEALKVGVDYAVSSLGSKNGYLSNSLVKIPLPDNLAKVETLLRKAGGNKIADNLINSMNNAATKAVPQTAQILAKSIESMSLNDAKKILAGGKNAATDYFKSNTSNSLKNLIKPIIQETMRENQVAQYYDMANNFYKNNLSSYVKDSSIMGLAKNFGVDSYIPGNSDENIDDYVTNKTLDGLFKMISQKEGQIRQNPAFQTTSLLKKVFGN